MDRKTEAASSASSDLRTALDRVLIRCQECKKPMTVVCRPVRSNTECSENCHDGAHIHIRCENCSMPDFWTSIHFSPDPAGAPVPSQGKKVASN